MSVQYNKQINIHQGGRVLHQGWVEKRTKGVFSTSWKKRWLVLRTNGVLALFEERPKSLLGKTEPTKTYKIEPDSTVSRIGAKLRLTWGAKVSGTFQERFIRPYLDKKRDEKEDTKMRASNPESEKWFRFLNEVALQNRLRYVLNNRKKPANGGTSYVFDKAWRDTEKKISQLQGNLLTKKFYEDQRLLWKNAVRYKRTSDGDKVYFEFGHCNLEILWKIYSEGRDFMSKKELLFFLYDAWVESQRLASKKTPLSLDEWAYTAKVYLDKDMDGKVFWKEFQLVNTPEFWLKIDFLTPLNLQLATDKLWLSIFDCLEKTGALSPSLIYRVFEKYDTQDEGFLYQKDMERFLEDFMRSTPLKWPSIEKKAIEDFCASRVVRGAIALRFLDQDETGRVSREEFKAIGLSSFWSHVDYLTTVDANEGLDDEDSHLGIDDENQDMCSILVSEVVDNVYSSYVDYANDHPELCLDKVIARPSFSKEKWSDLVSVTNHSRLSSFGSENVYTKRDLPENVNLPSMDGSLHSRSYFHEHDIDLRLLDVQSINTADYVDVIAETPDEHNEEYSISLPVDIEIDFNQSGA